MDCELDHFLELVDPELKATALQMRQISQQFTPMTLSKLAKRRQMLGHRRCEALQCRHCRCPAPRLLSSSLTWSQ